MSRRCNRRHARAGFTLVELMIVVFIIAVLMSVLLPVVSGVRKRGFEMRTRSLVQKLASACQVYYSDWHAYPGLLPDSQLYPNPNNLFQDIKVTSTENLTLSLLGFSTGGQPPPYVYSTLWTTGPVSLNPANPKQYHAYIDYIPAELDWRPTATGGDGTYVKQYNPQFISNSPANLDTVIPEFLDGYSEPKAILYLRATRGAQAVIDDATDTLYATSRGPTQYRQGDVLVYTGQATSTDPTDKTQPFDALRFSPPGPSHVQQYFYSWYDAFRNEGLSPLDPNKPGSALAGSNEVAKGKDGFLLIGAGSSRIWLARDSIIVSN